MELNKEAVEAAIAAWRNGAYVEGMITTYFEALPKPAPKMRSIPFDAANVKPGDEVICLENNRIKRFYVGMTKDGDVVTETPDDDHDLLSHWSQKAVTIAVPFEAVKVALFRFESGYLNSFMSSDQPPSGWEMVSDGWTDIEVTR